MYDNNGNLLMLSDGNLYAGGALFYYEDGTAELERPAAPFVLPAESQYYTVRQGDFIDGIAWRHYKEVAENPDAWWWLIADANQIENPLDLSEYVGQEIVIPDLLGHKLIAETED